MNKGYESAFEHLEDICDSVRQILTSDASGIISITERLINRENASKIMLPLVAIKKRFGLNGFEYLCLMLALSARMGVFAGTPSFKNALDIYSGIGRVDEKLHQAFCFGQPLSFLLEFSSDGQFRIMEVAYQCILGKQSIKGRALNFCSADDVTGMPVLYPQEKRNINSFIKTADKPVLIRIQAASGSGKRTLARQACKALRKNALLVSLQASAGEEEKDRLVNQIVCISIITDSLPIIHSGENIDGEIVRKITDVMRTTFLCEDGEQVNAAVFSDFWVYEVILRTNSSAIARAVWLHAKGELDINVELLSERYELSAGQIVGIAKAVLNQKAAKIAGASDMDAIRTQIGRLNKNSAYARVVVPAFGMERLVVDAKVEKRLQEIVTVMTVRHKIYDQYGYNRLFPYGKGIGVLFYGASGTGKTMAAQALARELGLEVLAADISRIMDKYIGETEKHINGIFEAAAQSNCILFFDEADSLFSRRTDVSNSLDKSANTQTSHLLQKMEEYDGVVILATNLIDNIDEAFRRRLPYIIEFHKPDIALRKRLWLEFITEEIPTRDIDFDYLAENFELTPAVIKWAAFSAAAKAVAQNMPITTEHIKDSLFYEYEKMGITFPSKERGKVIID